MSEPIGTFTGRLLIEQMKTAAKAVHEWNTANPTRRPVVVAPGGIGSAGVEYYRWFKLWNGGASPCEPAQAYADYAYQGVGSEGDKTILLPNCAYPDTDPSHTYPARPIYANDAEALRELYQTVYLIDHMKETEMDCVNLHVFGGHPDMGPQLRATREVFRAFEMPPPAGSTKPCWISDAIGQKNNTPANEQGKKAATFTGMGVADAPAYLGLEIASLFGARDSDGDNSLSTINDDQTPGHPENRQGNLNGYGCDVRDTWRDLNLVANPLGSWTQHQAERGECFSDLYEYKP